MAFDLKSWLTGFFMGLAGLPCILPNGEPTQPDEPVEPPAEPVAYLYNGVRLPKLPEWDREKYPYAHITIADWGEAILTIMSHQWYFDGTYMTTSASVYSKYGIYDNEWSEGINDVEIEGGIYLGENTTSGHFRLVWSNYNLRASADNNTVTFSASEPVPVYE